MGHRYTLTVSYPLHRLTDAERALYRRLEDAGLFQWRREYEQDTLDYDDLKARILTLCETQGLKHDTGAWAYMLEVGAFEGVPVVGSLMTKGVLQESFPTLGEGMFWERTPPTLLDWFLLFAGAPRWNWDRLGGRVGELCSRYVANMGLLKHNLWLSADSNRPNQAYPRWNELAPHESKAWKGLRKLLTSLEPDRHLDLVHLIAAERGSRWSEDAVLSLDGHSVFCQADDEAAQRAWADRDFAEQARVADLIERALRLDAGALEAIADEKADCWEDAYDKGVNRWIAMLGCGYHREVERYLLEEPLRR